MNRYRIKNECWEWFKTYCYYSFGFEGYFDDEINCKVIGYTTGGLGNIFVDYNTREITKNTNIMEELNDLFNKILNTKIEINNNLVELVEVIYE